MKRAHIPLLMLSAVVIVAVKNSSAQESTKRCQDGRTIGIASQWDKLAYDVPANDRDKYPLNYSISDTQGVTHPWVEVWERPKRLSRSAVAIKEEGEARCNGCQDAEKTPDELHISVFDRALANELGFA